MDSISINGHTTFWLDTKGILNCKLYNNNSEHKLDYKTAQLFLEAVDSLYSGKPAPLLLDLRDVKGTFTNDAAQILSSTLKKMNWVTCEAYVVNSLSVKLLVQAYKRIYKTKIPFALFDQISEAEAYCLAMTDGLYQ